MIYKVSKIIVQAENKILTCKGFKEAKNNYKSLDLSQIKLFNNKSEAVTHIRVVYGLEIDINRFKFLKVDVEYNINDNEEV